jgi:hypothetical protein
MAESTDSKLKHLKWSVSRRAENQICALALFKLLTTYPGELRKGRYELFAQALVGITFSLWRAAFLADKSGKRENSLVSAIEFLEIVIADNAITYAQDKKQREWTFNYYTNNVRDALIALAKDRPNIVPEWKKAARSPKKRWEYGQKMLEQTVANFEMVLRSKLT